MKKVPKLKVGDKFLLSLTWNRTGGVPSWHMMWVRQLRINKIGRLYVNLG